MYITWAATLVNEAVALEAEPYCSHKRRVPKAFAAQTGKETFAGIHDSRNLFSNAIVE